MRRARASSSASARGRAIRWPAATRRRPSSIQLASGQSLSAREVPWMKTIALGSGAAGVAAAARPNAGGPPADGAEGARHQLARAVERMAVRLDPDRLRHQPARRPLVARALGAIGEAEARPARQQAHQRRLGQPLQVEHRVVALAAQAPDEGAHLAARRRAPASRSCSSGAAAARSPRRRRAPGAAAARSPARPPSRSSLADAPRRMSATTGSACTTSPSDDSLTIRMRTAAASPCRATLSAPRPRPGRRA